MRSLTLEQRSDRTAAGVIAGMAAKGGDTSLEQEAPPSVIKKCLARSECTEALGDGRFAIFVHPNPRDSARALPEIGSCPCAGGAGRQVKEHVSLELPGRVSHNDRQFTKSGLGALTLRMSEHHQGCASVHSLDGRAWRPIERRCPGVTGGCGVL